MVRTPVTIVGAGGGIGGWTALQIARVGCSHLTLYDDDRVARHNLRNQPYYTRHIRAGKEFYKVDALRGRLMDLARWHTSKGTDMGITFHRKRAGRETKFSGVVVVAVDTLEARREIFAAVKYNAAVKLLIEAGAGEYLGMVYALDPKDRDHVRWYEPTLSDEAAGVEQIMCVMPEVGPVFATVISRLITGFADIPRLVKPAQVAIDYSMLPVVFSQQVELGTP